MQMHKRLTTCVLALCAACAAFGEDADIKKLVDEARALDKEKKYEQAAAKYGRAAELADRYAARKAYYIADRFSMLDKAGKYDEAVKYALAFLQAQPAQDKKRGPDWRLNGLANNILQKKNYGAVTNFVQGVAALTDVSSGVRALADRIWGRMLVAQKQTNAARAHYRKMLDAGAPLVETITELRKTYAGNEERDGFTIAAKEFRSRAGNLDEKDKSRFWNDFGYDAYIALYYDGMKLATEELKKLGKPGVTKYGDRVPRSMEAFESIDSFPKKESEIRFPKSISDFGVKMTNGTSPRNSALTRRTRRRIFKKPSIPVHRASSSKIRASPGSSAWFTRAPTRKSFSKRVCGSSPSANGLKAASTATRCSC